MEKSKLAILVNSCDKYADAWDPFFCILSKEWPQSAEYSVYLNNENKEYECKYMAVNVINTGHEHTWTSRLRYAVNEIQSEYILFFLEDFFLLSKTDSQRFDSVFEQAEQDESVGFLWFPSKGADDLSGKRINSFFYEMKKNSPYRVNATLALWKRDFLLQMLFYDADPWTFELNSSKCSLFSGYKCIGVKPEYNPFDYSVNPRFGYGITGGKWLNKNEELFEKYNLNVNMQKLGVFAEEMSYKKISRTYNDNKKEDKIRLSKKIKKAGKKIIRFIRKKMKDIKLIIDFKKNCERLKT